MAGIHTDMVLLSYIHTTYSLHTYQVPRHNLLPVRGTYIRHTSQSYLRGDSVSLPFLPPRQPGLTHACLAEMDYLQPILMNI